MRSIYRRKGMIGRSSRTVVFLALIAFTAQADYRTIDLSASATSHHRDVFDRSNAINRFGAGRGFTGWFAPGEVTLLDIPFEIPARALDCISGSRDLKDSYWMPLCQGKTIYFLGSGDLVGEKVEKDLRIFNVEFIYADGSSEEILPVNVGAKIAGWYDGSVEPGSVASFDTLETFGGNTIVPYYVSVYAVAPSRPGQIKAILFNDNDSSGDYCIAAITESDESVEWITGMQKKRVHPPEIIEEIPEVSITPYQNRKLPSAGKYTSRYFYSQY